MQVSLNETQAVFESDTALLQAVMWAVFAAVKALTDSKHAMAQALIVVFGVPTRNVVVPPESSQ